MHLHYSRTWQGHAAESTSATLRLCLPSRPKPRILRIEFEVSRLPRCLNASGTEPRPSKGAGLRSVDTRFWNRLAAAAAPSKTLEKLRAAARAVCSAIQRQGILAVEFGRDIEIQLQFDLGRLNC